MFPRFKGLTDLIDGLTHMARAAKTRWDKAEQRQTALRAAEADERKARKAREAARALEYRERLCSGEGEALIRAIIGAPEDDTLRLIFADWLEERGDVLRAELIRVQCELAHPPSRGSGSRRRAALKRREDRLLQSQGKMWAGPLAPVLDHYAFSRGFVDAVSLNGKLFLAQAEALFRLDPITCVKLTSMPADRIPELAACSYLSRLTHLMLALGTIDDAGAEALARSPHLNERITFNLLHNSISERGSRALHTRFGDRVFQVHDDEWL
jgi:uncharacterized protein (TIGR02996 family)